MIYPIGIQSFEKLREEGFTYVDKTRYIYQAATRGRYFFLSRPRRFGKSLLLSTMKAYFEGKRELFKGLAMETLEQEWNSYPVLYLDLNRGKYKDIDELQKVLNDNLTAWENANGIATQGETLSLRFMHVIKNLYTATGKQVVILIDEYDKPLLQNVLHTEVQDEMSATLKAFYSVLKSEDQYIRFAFLTGVTKFGKVSVFSDLNNLMDLSLDERYTAICGITEEELHQYFDGRIAELAEKLGKSVDETVETLRLQYDGYHFGANAVGVYNPFSLLNTMESLQIKDYWFETGTPTFLVELLKSTNYDLRRLQAKRISGDVLNGIDGLANNPIPMLYQSGYLTICGYNEEFRSYDLKFPNHEVEYGFTKFILPYYTPRTSNESVYYLQSFIEDVRGGDPEQFMQDLQTFFEAGDYRIAGDLEKYFQNAMYIVFRLMGLYSKVEYATARGRIDLVVGTTDYLYVVEIKLDGTTQEALQQIEDKGYAKPFALDKRKLYKIGVNFSSETRGISEWEIVE